MRLDLYYAECCRISNMGLLSSAPFSSVSLFFSLINPINNPAISIVSTVPNNSKNIIESQNGHLLPNLYNKYPGDYLDIETYKK